MTSGKRKEPTEITCERCGKTALWIGGRRKRFCSPTCSGGFRAGSQPRKPKDPRSRTKQHTELSRQLKIDRGQCFDCGLIITWHNVVCIDWDHRNPADKSFTISYVVGKMSWQTIEQEIAKCDAVCRNCHALRTHYKQQHQPVNGRTTIKPNRGQRRPRYKPHA
jgi:ribosomal protein L37E